MPAAAPAIEAIAVHANGVSGQSQEAAEARGARREELLDFVYWIDWRFAWAFGA